jgi:hypothetical protein
VKPTGASPVSRAASVVPSPTRKLLASLAAGLGFRRLRRELQLRHRDRGRPRALHPARLGFGQRRPGRGRQPRYSQEHRPGERHWARVTGRIEIDGQDIHDRSLDVVQLRARVGMVFQKATRSRKASTRTSPTGRAFTVSGGPRPTSTPSSRKACAGRRCGRRRRACLSSDVERAGLQLQSHYVVTRLSGLTAPKRCLRAHAPGAGGLQCRFAPGAAFAVNTAELLNPAWHTVEPGRWISPMPDIRSSSY